MNRLFGRQETIRTRRRASRATASRSRPSWRGRRFGLVDTGGYLHGADRRRGPRGRPGRSRRRRGRPRPARRRRARPASTEEDAQLARRLRRSTAPVLVVANKVDTAPRGGRRRRVPSRSGSASRSPCRPCTGAGPASSSTGWSTLLPELPTPTRRPRPRPRFAIVGRPNVGKSSLFNRLVGEERSRRLRGGGHHPRRVDAVVEWPAGPVRFVDTAGMRRAVRVQGVEYYSFVRASRAIERATSRPSSSTPPRASRPRTRRSPFRVLEAGSALLARRQQVGPRRGEGPTFKQLTEEADDASGARRSSGPRPCAARACRGSPTCSPTSASGGPGGASTAKVNELIQEAQGANPSAPVPGNAALRGPGLGRARRSFVFFGGGRAPGPGYRRYLENRLPRGLRSRGRPDPDAASGLDARTLAVSRERGRRRHTAGRYTSRQTGRGAAWLARLTGGQKVAGSNPAGPTDERDDGDRCRHPRPS